MFAKLNLPLNPTQPNFNVTEDFARYVMFNYLPIEPKALSDDVQEAFNSRGLEIGGVILFRRKTNSYCPAHSDVLWRDGSWMRWNCAVNWNLLQTPSVMQWYQVDLPEVLPNAGLNDQPIEYSLSGIHFGARGNRDHDQNFHLVAETDLMLPTLVRTDIPHTIKNHDQRDRWCLSVRFKENLTFSQVSEMLKDLVVGD